MGAARDWGAPLLAAAVAFAGLSAIDLGPSAGPAERRDDGGFAYAFPHAPVVADAGANATVVLLSDRAMPLGRDGPTDWRSPHVALQRSSPVTVLCRTPFPCATTHEVAPEGAPRLLRGGHNATRVTVHVFDAGAELVFSNGDAAEQARLTRTYAPEQLPTGTWYLGRDATAPNGTQKPPLAAQAFLGQARGLLAGLPEGGVATLETDALATWYGTLYVTLRVDDVVHAP